MKKTILSVVAISSLIVLSGCDEPGPKRVYTADQKVYECGTKTVVLEGKSKTIYGVKETGRDEFGFLTFGSTTAKISSRMTIYDWPAEPYRTVLLTDGTFTMPRPRDTMGRARPNETWSFRKQPNGKYFYGFNKYPNTKGMLPNGAWCERIH